MAKIKTIKAAPGSSMLMPKMARRPGFSNMKMPKMPKMSSSFPKVKMPKLKASKVKSYKGY